MILSDFQISYQPVYPGDEDSPLEKDINETQVLKLNYDQNTFSLVLSSINYDYPSNVLFSWKLDGFTMNGASRELLISYVIQVWIPVNTRCASGLFPKRNNNWFLKNVY